MRDLKKIDLIVEQYNYDDVPAFLLFGTSLSKLKEKLKLLLYRRYTNYTYRELAEYSKVTAQALNSAHNRATKLERYHAFADIHIDLMELCEEAGFGESEEEEKEGVDKIIDMIEKFQQLYKGDRKSVPLQDKLFKDMIIELKKL